MSDSIKMRTVSSLNGIRSLNAIVISSLYTLQYVCVCHVPDLLRNKYVGDMFLVKLLE